MFYLYFPNGILVLPNVILVVMLYWHWLMLCYHLHMTTLRSAGSGDNSVYFCHSKCWLLANLKAVPPASTISRYECIALPVTWGCMYFPYSAYWQYHEFTIKLVSIVHINIQYSFKCLSTWTSLWIKPFPSMLYGPPTKFPSFSTNAVICSVVAS